MARLCEDREFRPCSGRGHRRKGFGDLVLCRTHWEQRTKPYYVAELVGYAIDPRSGESHGGGKKPGATISIFESEFPGREMARWDVSSFPGRAFYRRKAEALCARFNREEEEAMSTIEEARISMGPEPSEEGLEEEEMVPPALPDEPEVAEEEPGEDEPAPAPEPEPTEDEQEERVQHEERKWWPDDREERKGGSDWG